VSGAIMEKPPVESGVGPIAVLFEGRAIGF